MLVGLLLTASVLIASLVRIEVSRRGEYEKAFDAAAAGVSAVQANMTQVFALLLLAADSLQTSDGALLSEPSLRRKFAASLGLKGQPIGALMFDAGNQLRAATPGVSVDPDELQKILRGLQQRTSTIPNVLPAITLAAFPAPVVPVAYPLNGPGNASTLVFLVDSTVFTSVFHGVLNGKAGWLRLDDHVGNAVVDVHQFVSAADADEAAISAAARSPAQAMQASVNYASRRLLLATGAPSAAPLVVSVGLIEADMLKDLQQRVSTTWLIFGVSMLVVMSLVTVTSIALRKFGLKEAHLRRLATIDILTGLPNRRSFHHLLARAVHTAHRQRQVFGLMFVDLDNFKDVNDSLGHEAGDQLLQRVGELLVLAVRKGDCVCRLGGDEFTVLLSNLSDADEAQRVGQRVLDTLAQPIRINEVEVRTRATIGIALMPQHATTMSDLMRFADTAMYRAKQDGKSICLIYDESMAAQALFKTQRAQELAHAIAHDELFLEYQPKYSLRTGEVTGHEALVRWQHPQRGLIGPAQFIALAEEAGLIVDLGQWVLERAVRQLREWHDDGAGWQDVAINVSALQLRSGRFSTCVHEALVRHGVPGCHLQLELTESSLVVDAEQARALVRQVHAMGSSVAVDDFGTGYSSLAALQQFNIDYLKIDRGFVKSIESHSGEEICRTVVSLAHGLKMRAVAEGVETTIQRDILRRLGCDEVQGFLYARPMPASEVLRQALAKTTTEAEQTSEALRPPWQMVA
jgi:diguanylate cyclase (GGDEF)-like protein